MARSFNLFVLLIVALSAVQAAVVRQGDVARLLPEGRASTVVSVVTVTAAGPTTVTKSTRLVCASLQEPISTTACRRKRQFWNAPLFFAVGHDDIHQFHPLNPTQVLQVEPSALPSLEYRNRPGFRPFEPQQFSGPFAVQSSFSNKFQPMAVRVASPFFGAGRYSAFSSLFSNIISGILTPAVTSTSTKTVYTTTTTTTLFTSTATYIVKKAQCVPSGVIVCPVDPTTTTTTTTPATESTTTTTPATESTTTTTPATESTTTTTPATESTTTTTSATESTTTTTPATESTTTTPATESTTTTPATESTTTTTPATESTTTTTTEAPVIQGK